MGQVHLGVRRPGLHEAAQFVQPEFQLLEFEIQTGVFGIRKPPHTAVHLDPDLVLRVFQNQVLQIEVVDVALHLSFDRSGKADVIYALGEVTDGGHRQEGARLNIGLQPDAVDEFGIIVQVTVHDELVQGQVRFAGVQAKSVDTHQGFSHVHVPGRCFVQGKAGVQFPHLQAFHRAGNVIVGHLYLRGQEAVYIGGEIVPVNHAFPVTASFLQHLGLLDGIEHMEGEIFHFHGFGTDEPAPGRRFFVGVRFELIVQYPV